MRYELVGGTQLKDGRRKSIGPANVRLQQAAKVLELLRATAHLSASTHLQLSELIRLAAFSSGQPLQIEAVGRIRQGSVARVHCRPGFRVSPSQRPI
ncbi:MULTISPECIES: hypothetical protein [unclassified Burkholderia]|uniref:hypothetical protein n=1 Tax=unclassified Burkholderia TaxID=2613784 RepID=UPI00214FBBCD|nr:MULTISPECIES: hypothetical protein [unclassified Burkholderia]MCR4471900.1 hypothetical protein [Burkholderia sp. SCN-KJ]